LQRKRVHRQRSRGDDGMIAAPLLSGGIIVRTIREYLRRAAGARVAAMVVFVLSAFAASAANATNFPVTGSISINGNPGVLPDGGIFGNSTYDPASGDITTGKFTFPQTTTSFDSQLGTITIVYQLSQTNTSTGQVVAGGAAVLTDASIQLDILSASIGIIPLDLGTCVFQPIVLQLRGTGAASGLDLADSGYVIPPVGATDCGNYGSYIDNALAGSNNTIQMHLAGNFTPPVDDTIFENGFDPATP
jgi:hypothetical protein